MGRSVPATSTVRVFAPGGAVKAKTEEAGRSKETSVKPTSKAGTAGSAAENTCTRSGAEVVPSTATRTLPTSDVVSRGVRTSWRAVRPATVVTGSTPTTVVGSSADSTASTASAGVLGTRLGAGAVLSSCSGRT